MCRKEKQSLRLILGGSALVFFALSGIYLARVVRDSHVDWHDASGEIVEAKVGRGLPRGRRMAPGEIFYEPKIRYRYTVEGKEFEGHQINLTRTFSSVSIKDVEAFLRDLDSRKPLRVFYDSARPENACLVEPKYTSELWMSVLLCGAGLAFLPGFIANERGKLPRGYLGFSLRPERLRPQRKWARLRRKGIRR